MALLPSEGKKIEQRKRLLLEKTQTNKLKDAFSSVVHTEEGRFLLWWILEQAKVFGSCFTGNATTYFNEGARELGLKVFAQIIEADDTAFATMQREAKKRLQEENIKNG